MKAEGDNLDTIKTTVRRLLLDIQKAICDEEDVIRNAIYEKLEAEISNDGDDCNDGPPPKISDFLKLTNDPLCMKIGKSYCTCGDEMFQYFSKQNLELSRSSREFDDEMFQLGRSLCAIGDDLQIRIERYIDIFELLILYDEYGARSINFTDLFNYALRLFKDGITWGRLCYFLYTVRTVAIRYLVVYLRRSMYMLLPDAERFIRRFEINRILNTRNINWRNTSPSKYAYIAVPAIAMAGTAFYFCWKS